MTTELVTSVGRESILSLLASLDDACEQGLLKDGHASNLTKGPFGVFQSSTPRPASSSSSSSGSSSSRQESVASLNPTEEVDEEIEHKPMSGVIDFPDLPTEDLLFGAVGTLFDFGQADPSLTELTTLTPQSDDIPSLLWTGCSTGDVLVETIASSRKASVLPLVPSRVC
jgi:hypothetical protein